MIIELQRILDLSVGASLITLAEKITIHGFIVGLFVLGFSITLLRSIAFPNGDQHQKLCGALSIFLIALVVNNYWFYLVAIFIGGLVVASEDFMLILVSILKAKRGDMTTIVQTFFELRKIAKYQVSVPIREEGQPASVPPSELGNVPTKK